MLSQLIVSIGMPRSGSGWHFNLVHDLIVASGGKDARWIRQKYHLQSILTEINCNIGAFTPKRMIPVMVPVVLGNKFVIKAHAGPSPLALLLIRHEKIIPTYIYRDPRDALLSAFEYGQRKREKNRSGAFSDLKTIEQAIKFMEEYIEISETWLSCDHVFTIRYEDFLTNYQHETTRLVDFLEIEPGEDRIKAIIEQYQPQRGQSEQVGTHFEKGKAGRYREKLSGEQQALCIQAFGPYLKKMGYPIP
jgi:hypothetical protein